MYWILSYKNNETENDHLHMNYEKNKRAAQKRSIIVDYSHVTMDIWWFLVRNSKKWRKNNENLTANKKRLSATDNACPFFSVCKY